MKIRWLVLPDGSKKLQYEVITTIHVKDSVKWGGTPYSYYYDKYENKSEWVDVEEVQEVMEWSDE